MITYEKGDNLKRSSSSPLSLRLYLYLIFFLLHKVENETRAQLPSKQGTSPEQTSALEESIYKLSGQLSTINRMQKYFRTRENRNFSTVKSTEGRIFNFSVVESGLMVCMAGLQVFIVKFFFQGARKGIFFLFSSSFFSSFLHPLPLLSPFLHLYSPSPFLKPIPLFSPSNPYFPSIQTPHPSSFLIPSMNKKKIHQTNQPTNIQLNARRIRIKIYQVFNSTHHSSCQVILKIHLLAARASKSQSLSSIHLSLSLSFPLSLLYNQIKSN